MRRNLIETVIGAVVVLVAVSFVVFAFRTSGVTTSSGYEVQAQFNDATGLNNGTDVRISGVKIGTVTSQSLDPVTYQAQVVMNIRDSVKLPTDSSARIIPEGLLGGNYVAVVPGAEEENIQPGGRIEFTQGAVNFVDLATRLFFNNSSDGGGPQ